MSKTTAALPSIKPRPKSICDPSLKPYSTMSFFMSIDFSPEIISDEQLEEVADGLADVENNSCVALYQATAQINL
jgi:hypothetical protein